VKGEPGFERSRDEWLNIRDRLVRPALGARTSTPTLDRAELEIEEEREKVGTIADEDYIKWVQRSLNRIYHLNLDVDGKESPAYQAAVKRFNEEYVEKLVDDQVDARTQDQLILANETVDIYIRWVQEALNKVGAGHLKPTGVIDTQTVDAVKSFQRSMMGKIKVDGYIGAKTELALIEASKTSPPGSTPKPKPKPKPKPVQPWEDPAVIERRYYEWTNKMFAEVRDHLSRDPGDEESKRLYCLLGKLKKRTGGGEYKYIQQGTARSFVLGKEFSFTKGYKPDEIADDAKEDLRNKVKYVLKWEGGTYSAFKEWAIWLYEQIDTGLVEIGKLYAVHGDMNNGARMLNAWGRKRQEPGIMSVLGCFK
jgi:peptidoglycan hydrolase-like protein with peptidoglycan-binding domain